MMDYVEMAKGQSFLGFRCHYWRIFSPLKDAKADSGRGGAKKCIQDPTTAVHGYHYRRSCCRLTFLFQNC